MQTHDTVLVPFDFSDASFEALEVGSSLAAELDLELVLLHIYQTPAAVYPGLGVAASPSFSEDVPRAARKAIQELALEAGGVRAIAREGEPLVTILETIVELGPRFVIMGTHARRSIWHLLMGSVTEDVVRQSPVPVMVVKARREALAMSREPADTINDEPAEEAQRLG